MEPQQLFFKNANEFETWLAKNVDLQQGIWVKFAKKGSGVESLNYSEALDSALCYGWIDGQAKPIDASYYLQKFTPRRPKSMWSKRNVSKAEELINAGRMQPSGQAAIDAAKLDGRWQQAYDSPSKIAMPEDFASALADTPKAKAFFDTLNKTNTFAFLWRIQTAKKPETRTARIKKFVDMLERGEKLH